MKKEILFIAFAIGLLTACKRVELPVKTPNCIEKEIKQILAADPTNPRSEVWQYDYKGETVYYFPPACCDIPSKLYNSKCDLICQPDGGFTGGGDGKCPDFFTERKNELLFWRDDR